MLISGLATFDTVYAVENINERTVDVLQSVAIECDHVRFLPFHRFYRCNTRPHGHTRHCSTLENETDAPDTHGLCK